MRCIVLSTISLGLTLSLLATAPARAQNNQSFVTFTGGNDANDCTFATPCRSIPAALGKTNINGRIDCLTIPQSFIFIVTKSVTIDCSGVDWVFVHGVVAVTINLTTDTMSDPAQTVRLRGFTLDGVRVGPRGILINNARTVILEDMKITNEAQHGILDLRSTPGNLIVKDSILTGNAITGIAVAAAGSTNGATLDNVTSVGNGFGIAVGAGNKVSISHSVFSHNAVAGVETDPGATIGMESSVVAFNQTGLLNNGTMFISNSDIRFNQTGISGTTVSFGNNRIYGNATPGASPSVGAPSTDHGQQ